MNPFKSFCSLTVLLSAAIIALSGAGSFAGDNPAFAVGKTVPAFQAKTLDGRVIKFPSDYKGRVVLLDFWATWCGPCRAEIPNVVAAYGKYQAKGFEVLGVSLDQAKQGPNLLKFTKDNRMPWLQVYDGKYWKADVAVLFDIHSIPSAFLVDGDTGVILAEDSGTRGKNLARAIEQALAAKTKKP